MSLVLREKITMKITPLNTKHEYPHFGGGSLWWGKKTDTHREVSRTLRYWKITKRWYGQDNMIVKDDEGGFYLFEPPYQTAEEWWVANNKPQCTIPEEDNGLIVVEKGSIDWGKVFPQGPAGGQYE